MERQSYAEKMQREMIHEIELARPQYLIPIQVAASWLRRAGSKRLIFHLGERVHPKAV
jgi:hypothetical protein